MVQDPERRAGAETASASARRFEVATMALGIATAVALAFLHLPVPDVAALAVFVPLMVWAENTAVLLPSTASVSPSFMVVMAAVVAFDGHGAVVGAAITCGAGALEWRQLRERRWRVVGFNAAQFVVAGAAAGAAHELLSGRSVEAVAMVGAGIAYAAVNVGIVLPAVGLEEGHTVGEVWADMHPSLANYVAFGTLGTLVGMVYTSLGPAAVVLLAVPIAIAQSAFRSLLAVRDARRATIDVFLHAIAVKDPYTAGHIERVARYAGYIGEELRLPRRDLARLHDAALMHDVGKLALPKDLLVKPTKLTEEEFAEVRRHAALCVDILGAVDFLRPLTAVAAGHHRFYDGGGYGAHSPGRLDASIVAVADAFDAMTSTRAYRKALPQRVAFDELRSKAGTQLHPACVDALISSLTRRGEEHGADHEDTVVDYGVAPPAAGPGSAALGDLATGA